MSNNVIDIKTYEKNLVLESGDMVINDDKRATEHYNECNGIIKECEFRPNGT